MATEAFVEAPSDRLNVESAGTIRFKADRRQLGGIMLLLGICATIEPLADIAYFIGEGDIEDRELIHMASFAAGLAQIVVGSAAVVVGFLSLVHDGGNKKLSKSLLVLVQLVWAPFITRVYMLVESTVGPYELRTFETVSGEETDRYIANQFVPAEYLPTVRDVRAVGSLGILGEIAHMLAFYGALSFTAFAVYSFDSGNPMARDARFYRSRLLAYSFVIVVAGLSQLLLGAYFIFEFGSGPLNPVINVAMYSCYYPEINVAVGSLQMLIGYFGIARYLGFVPVGPKNHHFQIAILLQWISMLAMQYIVQISLSLENGPPAHLPAMVLLSVGLNVLPAFLDYKMRTTPSSISKEFYGLVEPLDSLKQIFQEERFGGSRPTLKKSSSERRKKAKSQSRKNEQSLSMNINQRRANELHPLMSGDFLQDAPTVRRTLKDDSPVALHRYAIDGPEQEEYPDEEEVEITEEIDFYDKPLDRARDSAQLESSRAEENDLSWTEMGDEEENKQIAETDDESLEDNEMQTRDPPGVSRSHLQPSFDEDSETPDDSTEVLEGLLDEVERGLYTDSMEAFRKSLTEIL